MLLSYVKRLNKGRLFLNPMDYSIFNISDVHIGDKNSLVTPLLFLSQDQRKSSYVTRAQRSAVLQSLEANVAKTDITVVNGDLYNRAVTGVDEPQTASSLNFTLNLLERWATRYPQKTFYMILGNHEGDAGNPHARDALISLANRFPNLHVNDYGVIIGDVLFTHGDLQQQSAPHASMRDCMNVRCHSGVEANERTANLYAFLLEHLQSADYHGEMQVLRHQNGEQPMVCALTAQELEHSHVMFGHTHEYANMVRSNGKTLGNSATFKHSPYWVGHGIETPAQLYQPIIDMKDGKLVEKSRAFPAVECWSDLANATRNAGRERF